MPRVVSFLATIASLEFIDTALGKRHIQDTLLPLAQTGISPPWRSGNIPQGDRGLEIAMPYWISREATNAFQEASTNLSREPWKMSRIFKISGMLDRLGHHVAEVAL